MRRLLLWLLVPAGVLFSGASVLAGDAVDTSWSATGSFPRTEASSGRLDSDCWQLYKSQFLYLSRDRKAIVAGNGLQNSFAVLRLEKPLPADAAVIIGGDDGVSYVLTDESVYAYASRSGKWFTLRFELSRKKGEWNVPVGQRNLLLVYTADRLYLLTPASTTWRVIERENGDMGELNQ
ncbi:MAG: hypothetical protein D6741_11180 [Planctomycetota bacterium]|nr:MAG: hypothetical protein D6741_11180 [Planctomycetota bacterium]